MTDLRKYILQELPDFFSGSEKEALARCILQDAFGMSLSDILGNKVTKISDEDAQRLRDILLRLHQNEPIQYILGNASFYDMTFVVNPDVLIPRPETEELVQWIIEENRGNAVKIVDMGTGSGCIAVTLAQKLPKAHVTAWDVSGAALCVAKENARRNGVNVLFREVDILHSEHISEPFDVIVSNPPYIGESEKKEMQQNVTDYEPHLALFVPDDDVLIFYRKIAEFALRNLSETGCLFFEINQKRGKETEEMLYQKGFSKVELRRDISGNERMIKAQR